MEYFARFQDVHGSSAEDRIYGGVTTLLPVQHSRLHGWGSPATDLRQPPILSASPPRQGFSYSTVADVGGITVDL